jgi:hypothetical protein
MQELLQFIQHLAIDDRFYWRVGLIGRVGHAEVIWQRRDGATPWRLRLSDTTEWTAFGGAELELRLAAASVDTDDLQRQLSASILTQAVFAEMVVDGARKIFGEDVVQRSVADTQAFLDVVRDTAQRVTEPASDVEQRLRIVRDDQLATT